MKISEVIKTLEQMEEKYGNINCIVKVIEYDCLSYQYVNDIDVKEIDGEETILIEL